MLSKIISGITSTLVLIGLFSNLTELSIACTMDRSIYDVIVTQPLPWLHVVGKWVKDEEGNIVVLRGANYMGAEFGWFNHKESDYARMKSWGFNVVRQPIAWSYVEPSRGYYNESYLEYVDKLVSWCKKYGLYMALDMHQFHWAHKFAYGTGNGLPEWAVAQWPTEEEAKIGFWNNETLKGYFYNMWKYVATRYANESTIAAYDLFNEPNPPELASIIYDFYDKTIEAMRSIDSKHICMYEPPWGDEDPMKKVNQPNLIFSTHLYTGGTGDGRTGYNGDINMLEQDMYRGYSKAVLEWNIPLWVGEFGIGVSATRAAQWARDMLSLMDKYMIGSAWWCYWKDYVYGLLYPNGTGKEFISILDRPYPMLSSEEPSRFSYENNHFSMVFQPSGGETMWVALHIPQFFGNFTVSSNATDWSYSWDMESRVVNVTFTSETACEVNLSPLITEFSFSPAIPWPNEPVLFNAYSSNGTIKAYTWDFGDGNVTTTTLPTINHAYSNVGKYTMILNITSKYGLCPPTLSLHSQIRVTYRTDLNKDGIVNIMDIAIVAKAYGSKLGDSNWNAIADVAEPYGEINIMDIAAVAKDYGKTV